MKKSKSPKSKTKTTPKSSPRAPQPSGPTLIPPTAGTCSTCFYGQTFAQTGGDRLCRNAHPNVTPPAPGRWPTVRDDDWCGDGEDMTTYGAFAPDWY